MLIASHTHSAVDNVLARLLACGVEGVLRVGAAARVAPEVAHKLLGE